MLLCGAARVRVYRRDCLLVFSVDGLHLASHNVQLAHTFHGWKSIMHIQRHILVMLTAVFLAYASGCGSATSSAVSSSEADGDLLGDLLGDIDLTEGGPAEVSNEPVAAVTSESPPVAMAVTEKLELRLQLGERFPLVKTIKQNLVQNSAEFPASAETELQMYMVIEVSDLKADAIMLSVHYSRISYQHDINGARMAYDSQTHQGIVPQEIAPYAGMVNNGFSFWLGRDNAIQQLVGYEEFLQRCVQHVPVEQRGQMLADISARFGDDGVANFVDDTIGLLPFDRSVDQESATRVAVGDVWTRERRLMQPVSVYMTSTCRLLALNDRTAEINITGTIGDGQSYSGSPGSQQASVKITGGRSMGSCTIDRATGLPLQLNRSVFLSMAVTTAQGQSVQQDKRIETTIQAFPVAQRPVVLAPPVSFPSPHSQSPGSAGSHVTGEMLRSAPTTSPQSVANYGNAIMQTSGRVKSAQSAGVSQIPTQPARQARDTSHLSSTTTAIYPPD